MKDLLNRELQVGDKVMLLYYGVRPKGIEEHSRYHIGIVVGFTAKTVRVENEYTKTTYLTWTPQYFNDRKPCSWCNKGGNYLIKIDNENK